MNYETKESRDFKDHWHVEAIDEEGRVFVAIFSGPDAQERAIEYAKLKNSASKTMTSKAQST
jgi:hypothetical protein